MVKGHLQNTENKPDKHAEIHYYMRPSEINANFRTAFTEGKVLTTYANFLFSTIYIENNQHMDFGQTYYKTCASTLDHPECKLCELVTRITADQKLGKEKGVLWKNISY
jgi:hypothetical protein